MELLIQNGYDSPYFLACGAHSETYRIRETATGKWYLGKISREKDILWRESVLLQNLIHPLFPKWKAYFSDHEKACLVMEYIAGCNLEELLKRRGRMSVRATAGIMLDLADGLSYLHERNPAVIYRDLKPSNIIIGQEGRVRLVDLGAAGSDHKMKAGTPAYAAPEQFSEKGGSTRTDIYAYGKVMHYMLTGKNPCVPPYQMLPARNYDKKIPRDMERIIECCLADDAAVRYPRMRDVKRQILYVYGNLSRKSLWGGFKLADGKKKGKVYYEKNILKGNYIGEKDFQI